MCLVALVALVYSSPKLFQKLLYYPGQTYKKKLLEVLRNDSKKIKVISQANAGYKFGPLRRRLIFGSQKPFNYSTNSANHQYIIIDPADSQRIDEFVSDASAQDPSDPKRKKIYGFFHPYCNAGGGGERVLWQAVHDTLNESEHNIVAIYTGDTIHGETTELDIVENVKKRFNLHLKYERLVLVHLTRRQLVDGKYWKNFTLLGQAFGSVVLAYEAMKSLPPDIFIDTMGFPFTYPFVKYFLKIPVVSYTHFPIIQKEMITKLVSENRKIPKLSIQFFKSLIKYGYWKIFMIVYSFTGYFIDIPLCNGSWTYNHLNKIWKVISGNSKNPRSVKLEILYPPCSTEDLIVKDSKINNEREPLTFISLAQFRPEKRHSLIITEFAKFLENFDSKQIQNQPVLILIGSIRSESDLKFVEGLKDLATKLKVQDSIKFITDAPFEQVKQLMKKATFGINAMWNEHFGIAVVEMMASGLIPISHASAGPYLDIAVNWDLKNSMETFDKSEKTRTGFFFKSKELDFDYNSEFELEFLELNKVFMKVSKLTNIEKKEIRERAQQCVLQKFSNSTFDKQWLKYLEKMDLLELSFRDDKDKNVKLY